MTRVLQLAALVCAVFCITAVHLAAQSGRAATQVTLTMSPGNGAVAGQAVTITTVVTSASGKPRGAVHVYVDETLLATVPLSTDGAQSTAAIETTKLAQGPHLVRARYEGHPQFSPSASTTVTYLVRGQ